MSQSGCRRRRPTGRQGEVKLVEREVRCGRLARLEDGEQSRVRRGVEDCKELKMKSGDVDDLTPHAGDDLPALRTTPFQEGEDDAGIVAKGCS